ncbi:hypothetical protein [Paenibacillus rigui]|nr:hypothetical protein [Paenibacillus rigui]
MSFIYFGYLGKRVPSGTMAKPFILVFILGGNYLDKQAVPRDTAKPLSK